MDPREEMRDLKKNPLPTIVIVDPFTAVWHLDGQIAAMQAEIALLQEKRTEALNYALDNAIEEDEQCKLVVKSTVSTPNQVIDVDKIQKDLPKVYERIWDLKRSEAKAELEKFGEKVEENKAKITLSQKLVEPAMKAEGHKLEEVLIPGGPDKISYTYEVKKK
jgi:hypothetical protein